MSKIIPSNFIAKAKIHSGRRATIPAEVWKKWGLKDGDYIIFYYDVEGTVCIAKHEARGHFQVVRD